MARNTRQPARQAANLSGDEVRAAIPRLRKRIEELEQFDMASINDRYAPQFQVLDQKFDETLVSVFGADTLDYERLEDSYGLQNAAINADSLEEAREDFGRAITKRVAVLKGMIETLEEKVQLTGDSPRGRALRAFGDLDLHKEINRACAGLFNDGHYANAVEDACKVLDGLVKIRSGRSDLSGTSLMQTAFSPNQPILRFSALASESDRNEQQGMMFLYVGAMQALRNPRAHEVMKDDPEQALEYIAFLSMLAKALDRARK